jgi:transposase
LNCFNIAKHCKFDTCGTVVPNTTTTSAPAVVIKMATYTGEERANCVFWFEETKSATQVQREFRTQYRKDPPSRPTIYSWHKTFVETGCSVRHGKSPGRPCVSDATVEQLRESFVQSPRKSTRCVSRETGIPNATVWRVLRTRLHLEA